MSPIPQFTGTAGRNYPAEVVELRNQIRHAIARLEQGDRSAARQFLKVAAIDRLPRGRPTREQLAQLEAHRLRGEAYQAIQALDRGKAQDVLEHLARVLRA